MITQFLFSDSTLDSSLKSTARDPDNPEHFEQGDAQLHKIGPTDQVRRVDVVYQKENGWSGGFRMFDKDGKQLLIYGADLFKEAEENTCEWSIHSTVLQDD
jgi:hypothetical protein